LNAAIQRISNLRPPKKRDNVTRQNSKGAAIKAIEAQIANLDLWQKRGSIEYVDGPQRIRGLAGSGKTVVLALKAAYLHVKRPDWKIVVTFNTRSLYQQFESLIQRFVFAQIGDGPDWEKLIVMHAWGAYDRPGIYSTVASTLGIPFRDFGTTSRMFGYNQAFDGACKEVLASVKDRDLDLFDVMLIDEAQDLPASASILPKPCRCGRPTLIQHPILLSHLQDVDCPYALQ
jgi:superfamily I DNA and RNA helicase